MFSGLFITASVVPWIFSQTTGFYLVVVVVLKAFVPTTNVVAHDQRLTTLIQLNHHKVIRSLDHRTTLLNAISYTVWLNLLVQKNPAAQLISGSCIIQKYFWNCKAIFIYTISNNLAIATESHVMKDENNEGHCVKDDLHQHWKDQSMLYCYIRWKNSVQVGCITFCHGVWYYT